MPIAVVLDMLLPALPDVLNAFLAVWLFAVGACVGSFINVVALRMPVGLGIARSGSRCPACLTPIRWYDNIPLLSWLMLRGQCRACQVWIPVRYPLVELLVAGLFLTLGLGEGLIGGRNLPPPPGAQSYFFLSPVQIWSIYGYHIILLVTLFTAALIDWDELTVPWQVFVPAALIGGGFPLLVPGVYPVPFVAGAVSVPWANSLATGVCGALAGSVAGLAVWPATGLYSAGLRRGALAATTTALTGLFFGWQAVLVVSTLTATAYLVAVFVAPCSPRLRTGPWLAYLLISAILFLLSWRGLAQRGTALGLGRPVALAVTVAVTVLFVAGVSVLTRRIVRNRVLDSRVHPAKGDVMSPVEAHKNRKAILESPSYLPVELDAQFLQQPELRPVRVQLELVKPELGFSREGVDSTIVVFGGTQVVEAEVAQTALDRAERDLQEAPADTQRQRAVQRLTRIVAKACYYDAAREFGRIVSSNCQIDGKCDYVIVTGGGPGIMEAANRGAYDVGAKSIGLNITLPEEQAPNPFITPELCFQFHYFALRKMHFLMRAKALVVFPGGFGTLDELFDALTLRQTERMQEIPIILFGREYWDRVVDFQFLADEGVIADEHLDLISYAETPAEAWKIIARFHNHGDA